MFKLGVRSFFILLFSLSILNTSVSAQVDSPVDSQGSDALNAINLLLELTKGSAKPSCARLTSKGQRFCPLVAKCPTSRPFCVTKSTYSGNSNRLVKFECECSDTLEPQTAGTGSGVKGVMSYGQLCPVLRLDQPCPETYYNGGFAVYDNNQKVISEGKTDISGKFLVKLDPGSYVIRVSQSSSFGEKIGRAVVQEFPVIVSKDKFTELRLSIQFPGPRPL